MKHTLDIAFEICCNDMINPVVMKRVESAGVIILFFIILRIDCTIKNNKICYEGEMLFLFGPFTMNSLVFKIHA